MPSVGYREKHFITLVPDAARAERNHLPESGKANCRNSLQKVERDAKGGKPEKAETKKEERRFNFTSERGRSERTICASDESDARDVTEARVRIQADHDANVCELDDPRDDVAAGVQIQSTRVWSGQSRKKTFVPYSMAHGERWSRCRKQFLA